jgi:hypothetical protein
MIVPSHRVGPGFLIDLGAEYLAAKQDDHGSIVQLPLEAKMQFSTFFRKHLLAGIVSVASLLFSLANLIFFGRGWNMFQLMMIGFGIWGLIYLAIRLFTLVTRFHFDGKRIKLARFCRSEREFVAADIAMIQMGNDQASAAVWLKDGSTFHLCFRVLPLAHWLPRLIELPSRRKGELEGGVNYAALGVALAPALMGLLVLLCLGGLGVLIGALAFRKLGGFNGGGALLNLGIGMCGLSLAAAYFGVYRQWRNSVAYFYWNGKTLSFRTFHRKRLRQIAISEIENAFTVRRSGNPAHAAGWLEVKLVDGEKFKIVQSFLPQADELILAIKRSMHLRSAVPVNAIRSWSGDGQELFARLKTHLEEGEEVTWLGRPLWTKVLDRIVTEIVFGTIPLVLGLSLAVIGGGGLQQGMGVNFFPMFVGLFFAAIGLYSVTAPWRYRRLLGNVIYGVTTERAVVLEGVTWSRQGAIQKSGVAVESWNAEMLTDFEIPPGNRDVVLGGKWQAGSKTWHWGNRGFFAVDDIEGAAKTLRWLVQQRTESDGQRA